MQNYIVMRSTADECMGACDISANPRITPYIYGCWSRTLNGILGCICWYQAKIGKPSQKAVSSLEDFRICSVVGADQPGNWSEVHSPKGLHDSKTTAVHCGVAMKKIRPDSPHYEAWPS